MLAQIVNENLSIEDFGCTTCFDDFKLSNYKKQLFCRDCMKIRNKDEVTIKNEKNAKISNSTIKSMFSCQRIGEKKKESNITNEDIDKDKQSDDQSLLSLAKFHNMKASSIKSELASAMQSVHNSKCIVKKLGTTNALNTSLEKMTKHPIKLTLRTNIIVILAAKKFLQLIDRKLSLAKLNMGHTRSILGPANLTSTMHLLPMDG